MIEVTYSIAEISVGIFQLKMPLPFRLNHINLYLLEEPDGWILIDTGLNTEKTTELWSEFLTSGFFQKQISKIILTHLHPDHIGMSAWLSRKLDVPVYISRGDWELAQFLWCNHSETAKALYEAYWKSFGLEKPMLDEMVENRMQYKKLVKELPSNIHFLDVGAILKVNEQEWHLLAAPGHTPEHICLWNPHKKILISGDHVLPTITPNISYLPVGLKNPLKSYLSSLEAFSHIDCNVYLPAHGPISTNLRERISEIMLHHQEKFTILMEFISERISVAEAMPILFSKDLPSHQLMFAYAETAAHLLYLAERNFLKFEDSGLLSFSNCEKKPKRLESCSVSY